MNFREGELTQVLAPRCRCERDLSHPRIRANCIYSTWGVLGLVFGSWGTPKVVEFFCPDCGITLQRSRDPAVRLKHK